MKLILTIQLLFSVAFAQIKADGITDNSTALKQWAKDGGGMLPAGIIRYTESLGLEILKDYKNPNTDAIDFAAYQYVKGAAPIQLIGNPKGTVLWFDNPDVTKPAIAYNMQGRDGNIVNGMISNLTLKGKGIGITTAYTTGLRLYDLKLIGFDNGLILNNAYYVDARNIHFEKCNRAEYDIRSHGSSFTNIKLAYCNKGFEVRSNKIGINNYYAQGCNIGIHAASGDNKFERVYLETQVSNDAQLIIGDTAGLRADGNIFESLTISAPNLKGIRWEKTAGTMTLNGGEAQSTTFEVIGTPSVKVTNFKGAIPEKIKVL